MHFDDEEYSGSDSDADDGFNEDMEALRRACLLTGTNPNELSTTNPHGGATTSTTATTATSSDDDDAEDDVELVRNLQKRFTNFEEPLSLISLSSLPSFGDEDDCETLRSIQRRFAAYNDGGLKEGAHNSLDKPEQVGVTNKIASEKEASNNLFVERNNNAEEGFPNCVDTNNVTPQNLGEHGGVVGTDLVEWHDSGAENVPALPLKTSGLPKSALAFIDAIKKNRSCQKVIRSKLMQIEAKMEEIRKLKERVKILKDFQVGCKKRTSQALSQKKDARVQLISAAKQRPSSKLSDKKIPAMYYGPSENPHAAIYREALTRFPISVIREKWSKKERENLAKGLKQQFQEMLLQQSVNMLNDADELSADASDFDKIIASIRDHDITPQNIRLFLPKINWEQLASMYVPSRSGAECQARWINCEDPLINGHPWTNVEEKNLLHIIQQKGMSNWIDIAVSLGTNRTPFQCLARYQRSLNASIIRREWTEEEDNKLQAAVEEFGESNWQVVASVMEGRFGTQCSTRWRKSLHPARKRSGKWTPEEDKRLKVAVKLFGPKSWWKIAEFIPGRMQAQCRERWVNSLDPSLNLDKWTAEEDFMLEEAIKENGYSWSKVAACVPRRTDNQCRRRWMTLFPEEVPLLRLAKRTLKAALVSNFVDRESERPALGPNDFLPLPARDPSSEPENVNPSAKKKKIYRQRRKRIKDTSSCNTCSEEVPKSTNGTEGEDGQEVGTSCGDLVIRAGEGSRRQKRKSIVNDAIHMSVGDGIAVKNKRRKSKSNRKIDKGTDTAECHLSSLPNSTSVVASNKVEGSERTKIKNVNRKTDKACLRNESADLSVSIQTPPPSLSHLGERVAPKDSRIASETDAELQYGENDKFGEGPQIQSLHPRSVQPDIPESGNSCAAVVRKRRKYKKSKFSDGACSSKVLEPGEDDMTLASSLPASCDPKSLSFSSKLAGSGLLEVQCTAREENYASPAGVSGRNRPKRLRTRDETSSHQMVEAETGDDMTLLDFCKKLKTTRTKPAGSADDNALSLFRKESEKTRTEPVECADDMTLALFCQRLKQRRGHQPAEKD